MPVSEKRKAAARAEKERKAEEAQSASEVRRRAVLAELEAEVEQLVEQRMAGLRARCAGTPANSGLPSDKTALVTSGCGAMCSPNIKWA